MNPESPVTAIPKIGPKYQRLLETLNIFTVKDLLYHFPFRYEDYSQKKYISELEIGDAVTLQVHLLKIDNIFTKYGKRLTKAKIQDMTGELDVVWFNQHYIKNTVTPGEEYFVSGKVDTFSGKKCIIGPTFEPANSQAINTARLVPVYSETAGLSSKWLRSKIDYALEKTKVPETLPNKIINKHNLLYVDNALAQIHFPTSKDTAEAAIRRFKYEELFLELLKVENRKNLWEQKLNGVPLDYKKYATEVLELKKTLPFTLSASQESAINKIFEDCAKKHPMNMLLEGDVGSGKTIVAVFGAFLAYLNGYKTLYMAPTEILANQHFETFQKFLESDNLASSNKVPKIIKKTGSSKTKLENEDFDIAIGTHALLYSEEALENVGLVVIDEQHRFGVEQRAKLVELGDKKQAPNLLTMTATPIPRTLALTLYGDLSISSLKPPKERKRTITTKVIPDSKRNEAFAWIKSKKQPTFVVCPLIEESEHDMLSNVKAAQVEYEKLKNGVFKDLNVGLLHGRMKGKEKQVVVDQFAQGEIDVLVSTPVIEVGIDIPEASVIVVESAERYGLASLHQLRGRVGRNANEAFCLLFMSNYSKKAFSRLKNLENIDNGLELAEIDMKLRGQGDIYGTMQHGFKQFKLASLDDLDLIELAKEDAKWVFENISSDEVSVLRDLVKKDEKQLN